MDWNYLYPEGQQPATLNGFVWNAAEEARSTRAPRNDKYGLRTMGYYDGGDLNYYYFMASNFATSDRWFNPMMSRTGPNRTYMIGATSQGYAYPVGTHANEQGVAYGAHDLSRTPGCRHQLEDLCESNVEQLYGTTLRSSLPDPLEPRGEFCMGPVDPDRVSP